MKAKLVLWAGGATAALCLWMANLNANDQDTSATSANQQQDQASSESGQQTALQNQPASINKASRFIGMKVLNQKGETLGKVQDVVFNLQSGQVAYVVLSKSGAKRGTGKYVAVPLSAFQPAPDQKRLVLNADKNRVESAKGFAKDNWPAIGSTASGAQPSVNEIIIIERPTPDQNPKPDQNQSQKKNPDQSPNQEQEQNQPSDAD